ncbi:DUF6476 family protein [Alphaproteobacteria bacterium]|nr:DUF6476 family protein [Alphaproteobacteria bacterium]MDA8544946.1 DUF6476 family protein [Alphaproteobacteria bacterium]MDA8624096.1 DUF6476 family protein [Alphaproteobacteria bacterium]MDA8625527.1 DUF6476 family protein [Alphaproteobacteria bacterium]MDA8780355.1 DUF6476 family protein [Alphaproteobacteria bacterium]
MSQDTGNQAAAETSSEEIPQPNSRYVRTLLVVVIGLGVLMVGGAIVVIGTVLSRLNNPETIPVKPGFGETEISIPAGAELVGLENGDARIVLSLKDNNGPLLILLDPRKGLEKGRVRLREE